jgi:ATP phosphoribosyltransferase
MSGAFARAGDDGRLTLAVPSKGRMSGPSLDLLKAAGLSFEINERSLHVPCMNAPVELLLVRPQDIPEYVQDGVVDAGITGGNLIAESGADVVTLIELGFGRCALEAAVPHDAPQQTLEDLDGLRVATTYPVSTRAALAELGRLLDSQAVFIGNPKTLDARATELERLELMLNGVVAGRRRRYLMMNAPTERVEELESILPSMGAPSVIALADPSQVALHAAVEADDIWDLLPRLKAAGASGILVLPVERVVP